MALYPAPTTTGIVNNYYFSGADRNDWNNYDFKGDENFNDNNRLSVRYSRRDKDQYQNGPLPLPADGGLATTTVIHSNSVVGSYVRILNSAYEQRTADRAIAHADGVRHSVRQAAVRSVRHQGNPEDELRFIQRSRSDAFQLRAAMRSSARALSGRIPTTSIVTQFNDVLFRLGRAPRPQGRRGVQAHQRLPQRRTLCARPDDLQPGIHGRSAESRGHRAMASRSSCWAGRRPAISATRTART